MSRKYVRDVLETGSFDEYPVAVLPELRLRFRAVVPWSSALTVGSRIRSEPDRDPATVNDCVGGANARETVEERV